MYNPCYENGNGIEVEAEAEAEARKAFEIRLYQADGQGEKGSIVLKSPLDLSGANLYYRQTEKHFITFSDTIGVAAISLDGEVGFHKTSFIPKVYCEKYNQLIQYDKKRCSVAQIE